MENLQVVRKKAGRKAGSKNKILGGIKITQKILLLELSKKLIKTRLTEAEINTIFRALNKPRFEQDEINTLCEKINISAPEQVNELSGVLREPLKISEKEIDEIYAICKEPRFTEAELHEVIDAYFELLQHTLIGKGLTVEIRGFGQFVMSLNKRFQTYKVKFKMGSRSKALLQEVNANYGSDKGKIWSEEHFADKPEEYKPLI